MAGATEIHGIGDAADMAAGIIAVTMMTTIPAGVAATNGTKFVRIAGAGERVASTAVFAVIAER